MVITIADNNSIGFAGYDEYQKNRESLRAVPINKVAPRSDTIEGENPSYPLTRELYLYTGDALYNQSHLVKYFIHFCYLSIISNT